MRIMKRSLTLRFVKYWSLFYLSVFINIIITQDDFLSEEDLDEDEDDEDDDDEDDDAVSEHFMLWIT